METFVSLLRRFKVWYLLLVAGLNDEDAGRGPTPSLVGLLGSAALALAVVDWGGEVERGVNLTAGVRPVGVVEGTSIPRSANVAICSSFCRASSCSWRYNA